MIRLIIVDDDANSRKTLKTLLSTFSDIHVVAECDSAITGINAIRRLSPDIVLVDVEMPGKNGFEMIAEVSDISFETIFITGFEQYAIRAIKASALDYLLKPVDAIEITEALNRFKQKIHTAATVKQIQWLLENYRAGRNEHITITIPTNNGFEFIRTDNIIRLESNSNYTTFHLVGHHKLVIAKTLKEMEELMPGNLFCRVHHSHLINISLVKSYKKADGGSILMADNTEIPVSRHRKNEFMAFLKQKK